MMSNFNNGKKEANVIIVSLPVEEGDDIMKEFFFASKADRMTRTKLRNTMREIF